VKTNLKIAYAVATILGGYASASHAADADAEVSGSSALAEIVVTAQRRNESIQDVPITIQAITGADLSNLSVETFDDAIKLLPNVTFGANGPGQGNIYMRGLSTGINGEQSSASIAPFPNVATYLDEASLTFPARNLDV
jgi:iron complex outermembrane recepter protein